MTRMGSSGISVCLIVILWHGLMTPVFGQSQGPLIPENGEASDQLPDGIRLPQKSENKGAWTLGLPLGFPEGIGLDLQYQVHPFWALAGFYHLPTPILVKAQIKSRKLVNRDELVIRSPDIVLPFRVQLGPHAGIGCRIFPFFSPLSFMLALETRILRVDSLVQSHLEIQDAETTVLTNTLFQVSASTQTDQRILRSTVGYRWDIESSSYFFSVFSGIAKPLASRSKIEARVRVLNPEASNPSSVNASNLRDAEIQQERVVHKKLVDELKKIETMSLPILGFSFGKDI